MTEPLSRLVQFAVARGLRLLFILLIALILIRLLKAITRRLVQPADAEAGSRVARLREQQMRTLAGLLYSAGSVLVLAGAILTALPELGFTITPVAAVVGFASLAIGFGAQHLVRDLISGLFVVLEDQYVVGDVVRIGKSVGRVEHLTLRRTVLRDAQGAIVTIANGEIRQVANLSRDWSQTFVSVTVPIEQPLEKVTSVLEHVCAELRGDTVWSATLVDGPRVLGVDSLTPEGTTLMIQARTPPTRQDDLARELRRRVKTRFEQERIRLNGVRRVELEGVEHTSESVSEGAS